MKKNDYSTQSQKKLIKVEVEFNRIVGETYPYRILLKDIGCVWNPYQKCWEKYDKFKQKDLEKIQKLGLNIQHCTIFKNIDINYTPIRRLKEHSIQIVACIGVVKELEPARSFVRNDGTIGYIQRFILIDNSGCIPCISWNLVGTRELKNNRVVAIQKANVMKSERGFELHCSNQTKIWIISEIPESISKFSIQRSYYKWIRKEIKPINKAHIGFNLKFYGMITEVQGIYNYKKNGKVKLMIIFILDDQTEAIKVSLFGDMCNELLTLTKEEQDQIAHMKPLERIDSFLVIEKINNLIGKKIIIKGAVKKNEFTKLLELIANRFYSIQPLEGVK